jgi:phospholipid/cholesterol/gamma-HCH transport system permease protein
MTPLLTIITDVTGVMGGATIAFLSLGITPDLYFSNILQNIRLADFLSGLSKSFFFGAEIAIISCNSGFRTTGGAAGVGRSTIQAVVTSSMVVLISDYFLTYLIQFIE